MNWLSLPDKRKYKTDENRLWHAIYQPYDQNRGSCGGGTEAYCVYVLLPMQQPTLTYS